jgi:hypothetical protein
VSWPRGFFEAQRFEANDGGRQDDGESKAEALGAFFGGANKHADGDGGAGAGESAEGKRKALYDAHPGGLYEAKGFGVVRIFAPLFRYEACDENQEAGGGERGRDQIEAAEEQFDLGFLRAAKQGLLDNLFENLADDAGEDGRPDQTQQKSLKHRSAGEVGRFP